MEVLEYTNIKRKVKDKDSDINIQVFDWINNSTLNFTFNANSKTVDVDFLELYINLLQKLLVTNQSTDIILKLTDSITHLKELKESINPKKLTEIKLAGKTLGRKSQSGFNTIK